MKTALVAFLAGLSLFVVIGATAVSNPSDLSSLVTIFSFDAAGQLRTSDSNDGLSIARGDSTGRSFIHKFGQTPDFDFTDGFVTIWDGANDAGINAMRYTYSSTNDIDSIISSATNDVGLVSVQGLDVNWQTNHQMVTLNGRTRVALSPTLRRINRMINVGNSNFVGNISCYITNSPTTAGVVNTPANVRGHIIDGNNQTLMALYTVPAGKTAYLRSWYVSVSGANKSSNYRVRLWARPFGQVFQLKHTSAISETGTSSIQHEYIEPEVFTEKSDIELRVSATENITGASVSGGFDIVLVDN